MLSRYLLIGTSALALILPGAAAQAANSSPQENARPAAPAGARDWRGVEALLKQYLAERERTLGEENPFTLLTAASLALVYKAEGRYAEAEQLYSRTLEESERTLGERNAFTRQTARALAKVRQADSEHGSRRAQQGGPAPLHHE
jgi:Tetratricopeptide repeat